MLCRSYHTVRTQRKSVYRKLGVSKDTELMRLIEEGKIRTEKRSKTQNGKWFCNAGDVLRYARI